MASVDPDLIALCETKKAGNIKKDDLSAYEVVEKNLKRGKEGLLLGVRKGTFKDVTEISDTEMKNIMTAKIEYPNFNLRVIVLHAPQETDKLEIRKEFYDELSVQVERCIMSGDKFLIFGDFNGKIDMCETNGLIAGTESANGKLMCELVKKHDLQVGNFHECCIGKWTRIQNSRKGGTKKSALDYALLPKDIHTSLNSILIDEEKVYCPYGKKIEKGVAQITYSDHCVMIMDLAVEIGRLRKDAEKISGWKYCEEGYKLYQVESEASLQFNTSAPTITEIYSSWEVGFEKLLAKCFRRRIFKGKPKRRDKNNKYKKLRELISKISRKGKIQRSVAKVYQQKLVEAELQRDAEARAERLKKTSEKLTVNERFSPNGYWKLKKAADKVTRKDKSVCSVLKDNGREVDSGCAIIQAYQEEFEKRLRNRNPAIGWEEYTSETNAVVRNWLDGESRSSPPFTKEEMDKAISTLKEDSSPGLDTYPPEVFTKAGDGVINSILFLCNQIKDLKKCPEQWDLVKIVAIYKNKGSKKELKHYRGIFLAVVMSKIFEKLVKGRIEEKLQRISLLQAGSRKKRGPPDNVFLFRGVMDHFKFTGKPLYITAYDFEQAFDSLWLEDSVLSLKNLGVEKEYLQLIYNLNKRAVVKVQTPFGLSPTFQTDPIVKQGTVLGPCICSSTTGEYCGINPGVCVGSAIISSLLYVDDIIDLSCTMEDFLASHQNALLFSKKKKLTLSGTKCFWMALNKKLGDGEIVALMIDGEKKVLYAQEIVYLGDVFNWLGNNDGLIEDRQRRGTKAMITIASLMAEIDVGAHHVNIMLLLYRSLFLSTILFNSQTWSNLRKKDIASLRTVQLKFLKRILGVPSSTANAFTYLELGVLPIEYEIEKRQLMFLHKILQLDQTDPVLQLFMEQRRFSEAGEKNWWTGVEPCLKKYGLPSDLNAIKSMSKDSYSTLVKKAINETALKHLKAECSGLKKTANLQYDALKLQEYLSVLYPSESKIIFKWRSETLDIKSHLSYKYGDVNCRGCGVMTEEPYHILNCGENQLITTDIDVLNLDQIDEVTKLELKRMVIRVTRFLERVSEDGDK